MNSINIGWDSTKRAETPYFHGDKVNGRKSKKKTLEGIAQRKTHQHISIGIYTHT